MLSAQNISCGYGTQDVVQDVSFMLGQNEILCLLGPNGCGKTTLLRALAGILPARGTVLLDGKPLLTQKREQIAMQVALFSQVSTLYFPYSVFETVMMGRYPHIKKGLFQSPSAQDKAIVEECLALVGMQSERGRSVMALSGGQLQRVMLARLFAQEPRIVLLDEPTNHLDIAHQAELIGHIRHWAAQGERAVLGVFHDIGLAMRICDRALLMKEGKIAAEGSGAALRTSDALKEVYGMDVAAFMREGLALWSQ